MITILNLFPSKKIMILFYKFTFLKRKLVYVPYLTIFIRDCLKRLDIAVKEIM